MKKATVAVMVAVLCLVLIAATSAEESRLRRLVSLSAFLRTHSVATFDYEKFIEGSIGGMLKTLDPHSIFMNRENYRRMQEDQIGRFYGIGMIISMRNGKITVVAPIANTPAARMGLRSGDVIYEINGESTEDMNTNGAVTLLRGKKGTKVGITIKRPGVKKLLHFTVERAEIPERTVEYSFMTDTETGYILLKSFGEKSGSEMLESLRSLRKQGMKRLILDLRNNPGGLLNAAVYISDLFLPKGNMVVSIKGRTSSDRIDFFAKKNMGFENLPVVVLINRGSASGSEIVAGAIQDNDRGLVVGKTSWGKGLVQSVFKIGSDEGLALTTAKYYTGSGRCIQRDYSRSFADYFNPNDDKIEKKEQNLPLFKTKIGRKVHAGGGITPDKEVDMGTLDSFLVNLRFRTSAFFRFAIKYTNGHSNISRNFIADRNVTESFKAFLKEQKIPFKEKEFKKNNRYIKTTIEQEILSAKYGLEAGTRRFLKIDEQFKKAVASFPESVALYRKSKAHHGKKQIAAKN